jgi:hypothetical protein
LRPSHASARQIQLCRRHLVTICRTLVWEGETRTLNARLPALVNIPLMIAATLVLSMAS